MPQDSVSASTAWRVYRGTKPVGQLPPPPVWRAPKFDPAQQGELLSLSNDLMEAGANDVRGDKYEVGEDVIDLINSALYLRRPVLVVGGPGSGKTSLAYSVARELALGPVLVWPITTRTTLQDGLYHYEPLARFHDSNVRKEKPIGAYFRLGPLGTAMLPWSNPRVLLIDEIDKSDVDLPNDLLNIFEEGEFDIPELMRVAKEENNHIVEIRTGDRGDNFVNINSGHIQAYSFPFVVMTSNDEREFPPAFLRRCIKVQMEVPREQDTLEKIVMNRFGFNKQEVKQFEETIKMFISNLEDQKLLATDQLLNAIYLVREHAELQKPEFLNKLLTRLDTL